MDIHLYLKEPYNLIIGPEIAIMTDYEDEAEIMQVIAIDSIMLHHLILPIDADHVHNDIMYRLFKNGWMFIVH